jgi:hypothetical protein
MVWDGAATVLDKIIPHWGGLYWVLCIVSLLIIHLYKWDERFVWDHNRFLCLQKHVYTPFYRCKVFPRTKICFYAFLCHCKFSAPIKTCFLPLLWCRMVGRIPLHLVWKVNGGSDIGQWLVTFTTFLACGGGIVWSYLNVVDGSIEQRLL